MQLSAIGHIANSCWHQIPAHFPFVKLGAHIIMPNHVETQNLASPLDQPKQTIQTDQPPKTDQPTQPDQTPQTDQPPPRSTNTTKGPSPHPQKNKFGPQSRNLASIIRGYKTGVTKNARQINPDFHWQSKYHDHIIRDSGAYGRISSYIIDNPRKWSADTFYTG